MIFQDFLEFCSFLGNDHSDPFRVSVMVERDRWIRNRVGCFRFHNSISIHKLLIRIDSNFDSIQFDISSFDYISSTVHVNFS